MPRYRVTFRKRFNARGAGSDAPVRLVSPPDGVIQDEVFVERDEPPSLHVQGVMDEDDDFMAFGTEVWEYEVADGREQEFEDELVNSEVVLEYEKMEPLPEEVPGPDTP
jgi:hypothetical protein